MKAWYFSNSDCRLRYGDNRAIKAGITHKVDGFVILCRRGLHGSVNPIDAMSYAPGPYVWRVEIGGEIVTGNDKLAGEDRTYLWGYDATEVLRKFARLCALDVVHLWDYPPVVMEYLKTGRDDLRDATWTAARYAAGAAARAADAALAAAWAADAAWAAEWEKQNRRLYRMLMNGRPF